MNQVTIILDGLEVSGAPGTSILELATEIGVKIPSLCYDPHLSALGACRVCLVEDEKTGRMLASCVTPISPGMMIRTDSPRVLENRRNVIELILASHPDSCIVCDKGNRCRLRKIATDLGVGIVSFEKIPSHHFVEDLNPFIERDVSKCIRCGRCIRADQEIAVVGAIDYTDRGFESRPATLLESPLEKTECNFCGICVSVCPTGALMEKIRPSTLSANRATPTVCTLCGAGCSILLEHNDKYILGVAPCEDKDSVNHISLCVKGHYGNDFVNSAKRLTKPMIRREGELTPASWDEALQAVVEGFVKIRDEKGGAAIGGIGGASCTNEENYLFQKLMRAGCFTNNIDGGGRIYGGAFSEGIKKVLGKGAMSNPISHIRDAQEIFVINGDPLVENPIAGQLIKQAVKFSGANLTLVYPVSQGLSFFAGCNIRIVPGTTSVFLAGVLREILRVGCPDPEAESRQCGWRVIFEDIVEPFTAKMVEKASGVPAKLIKRTAGILTSGKRVAFITGEGAAGEGDGYQSGVLLAALAAVTGNIGHPGCGLFPMAVSLNHQGAWDMGVGPDTLPGYGNPNNTKDRAIFEAGWGVKLPDTRGLDYLSMIEAAKDKRLSGLFVMGENPMHDCPELPEVAAALDALDFLVVADSFMTETAKIADVVLPSAVFAEKDGTWTSIERRVQKMTGALSPAGDSRTDWRIIVELFARLKLPADYDSPDDVLREINELVPIYRGITPEHLKLESVFWPCNDPKDPGEHILYLDVSAQTADLTGFTLSPPVPIDVNADRPFSLICNQSLFRSKDSVRTDHSRTLSKVGFDGNLMMNPFDAGPKGIFDGEVVRVYSKTGAVKVPINLSEEVPRGIIVAIDAPPFVMRQLTALSSRDEQYGTPAYHHVHVRVEATHA